MLYVGRTAHLLRQWVHPTNPSAVSMAESALALAAEMDRRAASDQTHVRSTWKTVLQHIRECGAEEEGLDRIRAATWRKRTDIGD